MNQAVVVLASPSDRSPCLIAHLIPHSVPGSPTLESLLPEQIRVYLQTRLPDYMLPALITLQETLPLTPNGKIDRSALPPYLNCVKRLTLLKLREPLLSNRCTTFGNRC
ncbi:MAG: amino acid adenylation domain-containing protein [Cyanobacteria bacterium RM1_2_2]|nr:amino acid adenylation domain-containing protein [Cyanobacteria bacterium RM1_2_2]